MRIVFDGTTLQPGRTGVGYYTEHLLHHLAEQARDDELIVLSNKPIDTTRALPRRVRTWTGRHGVPRMIWMQAFAPRIIRQLKPDVVHFTNGMVPLARACTTVVTIHDMSLTMYPHYHPPRRVLLNRPLVNLAARSASAIVTVSQSAKRDIVGCYGVAAARVHVVHEAAAPIFGPIHDVTALERVRRRYGLAERFILYVGTIEPRKNLPALIDGFARRRRAGDLPHQLVCAGPYGWLSRDVQKRIEQHGIADAVRFTGYVPFDDLPALYNLAEMFVFPSVYEGFGLPVIEAMACGAPVVTGRVAALTEIGGRAIEHVDRLDAEGLGEALVALSRDRERRNELTRLGLERARAFSWSAAARETLEIYRRAIRESAGAPVLDRAAAPLEVEATATVVHGHTTVADSQVIAQ